MDATTHDRSQSRFAQGTGHSLSLLLLVCLGILSCRSKGTVRVGGPCTLDISCTTQACIPESRDTKGVRWTGGYCSGNCLNTPCPDGQCRTLADNRAYCVSQCSTKDDCRSGYVCSTSVGSCLPDCRLGWSCGDSLTCDTGTGTCVLPIGQTKGIGDICSLNMECQGGLCIPPTLNDTSTGWTEGYCTQDCPTPGCPQGTMCQAFLDGNSRCLSSCAATADCRTGYVCNAEIKACLPDCRRGWSCGDSLTCDARNGNCVPLPVQTKAVGGSCSLNLECQGGLCIPPTLNDTSTGWTEGYCTQDCPTPGCPQGTMCQSFLDGNSRCLLSCAATADCRTGYVCNAEIKACLPDCRRGWSCGDSLTCDPGTGNCVPPPVQTKAVGGSCSLNVECQGGLCIPQTLNDTSTGWTEGYCTQDCPTPGCPQGTMCQAFLDGNSRCLLSCATTADCRTGYVCNAEIKACLPDCRRGWSCGATLACDASTGECRLPMTVDAGTKSDASPPSDAAPTPPDVNRDGPGSGAGGLGPGGPGGRL